MSFIKTCFLAVFFITGLIAANAAELAGKWTSEFDTQIGVQRYTFEFTADGKTFSGKATYDHPMGKGESKLNDIKMDGDDVTFTEKLKINDMEITIKYSGKIAGDEIRLMREVGEFATEQLVAKRAKAEAAKPAAST